MFEREAIGRTRPTATTELARAIDERAIERVLLHWCRAIDRLDLPSIRDIFHPDAIDDHVFYRGDVQGLLTALERRHANIAFSCHQLGNISIEFAGATTALVESYVHVTQHLNDKDGVARVQSSWCRYIDRFEARKADWRIAHRLLVIDAAVEEPLTSAQVFSVPAANMGRRDANDPLYAARIQVGIARPA